MFHRLSNKRLTCCNNVQCIPDHVRDIEAALRKLDEILIGYELNDYAFYREYTRYYKEWRSLERVYYKMLKRLSR